MEGAEAEPGTAPSPDASKLVEGFGEAGCADLETSRYVGQGLYLDLRVQ